LILAHDMMGELHHAVPTRNLTCLRRLKAKDKVGSGESNRSGARGDKSGLN
jgi:hypothetical protein